MGKDSCGKGRMFAEFYCDFCGILHRTEKRFIKEKTFCSTRCSMKNRTISDRIEVLCAMCGNKTIKCNSQLEKSKSGLYFCSRKCKDKAQRLDSKISKIWPNHYGNGDGIHQYREDAFKKLPNKCNVCGYARHPEVLDVHHKDMDRKNNDISNLEILCPTCHREKHFLTKTGLYSRRALGNGTA